MTVLADSLVLFQRQWATTVRSRISLVVGIIQPIAYLLLFGPLLENTLSGGQEDAWRIFIPGLLVQMIIFSSGFAGFSLIPDLRSGVVERMRVTPVSRLAMLLGRCFKDGALQFYQSVVLLVLGVALGLRASWPGALVTVVILVMLAISMSALSYTLAMSLPQEYLFAPLLNTIALPMMLLSGILLPLSLAPGWLRAAAHISPFYYIVNGLRDMFQGSFATSSVLVTLVLTVMLAVGSLWLGTWQFSREQA